MFAVHEDVRDGALSCEIQEGCLELRTLVHLVQLNRRVWLLQLIEEALCHATERAPTVETLGRVRERTKMRVWIELRRPHVVLEYSTTGALAMSDLMRSSSEDVSALQMSVLAREAGRAARSGEGMRSAEAVARRESRVSSAIEETAAQVWSRHEVATGTWRA